MEVNKNKYEVPVDYFEDVEQSILKKVGLPERSPSKSSGSEAVKRVYMVVAAIAASVLLIVGWSTLDDRPSSESYRISEEDMGYLYTLNEMDMVDLLTTEEITYVTATFETFTDREVLQGWEYIEDQTDDEFLLELL